ncbi:MAG: sensor histidine kinase [Candidatus Omnitrophica bacterium]|nr:sensor histidine kinase [Candidatus Omnitrophota bacterium]
MGYPAKAFSFSLRLKLIFIIIAMLSTAILSISVLFFINGRRILEERILSDLTALVDSKADRIVNLVELNCEQTSLIASRIFLRMKLEEVQESPFVSEKEMKEIIEVLSEVAESVKFIEGIDIIDISGKVIASSISENIGKDISHSKSFIEGKKGFYLADLYLEDNSLMYDISVPMLGLEENEDKTIGVLKIHMEARRLLNLLTDYTGLGKTGELELGTLEGENIIFLSPLRHRPDISFNFTVPLTAKHAEPMERAVKKEEGIMIGLDYRGAKVLAAYRYIPIGDWGLVAKIDFAEIFDSTEKLRIKTVLASILVLILSIIAILFLSDLIIKPLKRLQEGISIVTRGDLEYKIEVKSRDEIGQLAFLFNKMTENLNKITASRDDLNREIERRVEIEQKLTASLRVKADFTSKVSHELRTPLTAIREGIAIVIDGATGDINAEQKSFLELSKRNVDRLSRLIDNVLDFQKLEAGVVTLNMQQHNINGLIKEVSDAMVSVAKKKDLNLTVTLEENLPEVSYDRDKIIQVVMNLINNAIKFTDKGTITISTESGENFVQVTVKDTGPGIKKENLSKLFQPFMQLHSDLKKTLGGSGLGLVICKEIIEAHRGKIWVESELNQGAMISFILPIKERRI